MDKYVEIYQLYRRFESTREPNARHVDSCPVTLNVILFVLTIIAEKIEHNVFFKNVTSACVPE